MGDGALGSPGDSPVPPSTPPPPSEPEKLDSLINELRSVQMSAAEVSDRLEAALVRDRIKQIPIYMLPEEHRVVAYTMNSNGRADLGHEAWGDFIERRKSWWRYVFGDFAVMFSARG